MRRVVNCVAVAVALSGAAGLGGYFYKQHQAEQQVTDVSAGLRRFEQVLAFHGAGKETPATERGWPTTVEPVWFNGDPPRNWLVTQDRPWLEIATPEQAELADPPLRIALSNTVASFWYNPYRGVIRARVPISISDSKALELYNKANGTALDNIYCADAAPPLKAAAADQAPEGSPSAIASPMTAPVATPTKQAGAGDTPQQP